MRKKLVCIVLLFAVASSNAQLFDDFADGDLTANPSWNGQTGHFLVNAEKQLQLYTSGGGSAMITTENTLIDSTEWLFWIRLAFSPSSNNFARIYLASDQTDLSGSLNGYFLQFGESGSGDAIELFRQNGLGSQSVCRGKEGFISGSFSLKIKVIHQKEGIWKILTAPEGSALYQLEASGSDTIPVTSEFFGVWCIFTSSNSQKFYFDDIVVQAIQQDTTPPRVEQIIAFDHNQVVISFSEYVDGQDATDPSRYFIGSTGAIPVTAAISHQDPGQVYLLFANPFINGSSDHLHIMTIRDLAGNWLQDTVVPFAFYMPQAYDILLNEIMADPDPPQDLPRVEYIEMYNVTNWPVSLKNWTLNIGGNAKLFPEVSILPGSYLLVVKGDELKDAGSFIPLFSSNYSLSNEGTTLSLFNPDHQLIHSVDYSVEWCNDDWKKEGGWSLELIDPLNPCGEEGNWMACEDPSGGTPGRVNSVIAFNPDTIDPRLSRIGVDANDRICIWFSEKMDSSLLMNPLNYRLEPSVGNPVEMVSNGDFYRSLHLQFSVPMEGSSFYKFIITDTLTDCTGNRILPGAWKPVGIPVVAGTMDVVINEILLDPIGDGADFIEIYNRSGLFIDLKDLLLARLDTISSSLESAQNICAESNILAPGNFRVLTPDPSWITQHFICTDPDAFVTMTNWISFSKEASVIVLVRKHDEGVIDQVYYKESLHFDLFSHPEGISLERIHYDRPSDDLTNWHSASQTAGFATPGYQNSQFGIVPDEAEEWLTVAPEVFTPDNDGSGDLLNVYCTVTTPGYVISIHVFDPEGRRVRQVAVNSLMGIGMRNMYSWDGKNDAGILMDPDIYIIYAQAFDLNGNVKQAKRPCVLVNRNAR